MLTRYTFELEAVFLAKMRKNGKNQNIHTPWTPSWIGTKQTLSIVNTQMTIKSYKNSPRYASDHNLDVWLFHFSYMSAIRLHFKLNKFFIVIRPWSRNETGVSTLSLPWYELWPVSSFILYSYACGKLKVKVIPCRWWKLYTQSGEGGLIMFYVRIKKELA